MKQLMSFDPGEWSESLRKEYVLVIEGFFSVPLPLFSPTYRRAIKVRSNFISMLKYNFINTFFNLLYCEGKD